MISILTHLSRISVLTNSETAKLVICQPFRPENAGKYEKGKQKNVNPAGQLYMLSTISILTKSETAKLPQ